MLQTLQQMLAPAVMERLTLFANHVLGGEPVAVDKMRPHAGKVVQIEVVQWPALLPPWPPLAWRVTPAGLLEWCGSERDAAPELTVRLQADNPALLAVRLLGGEAPPTEIAGDSQLATDVNWLMQNLRWDLAADLERVFPAPLASAIHGAAQAVSRGVHGAVQGLDSLRDRWRR